MENVEEVLVPAPDLNAVEPPDPTAVIEQEPVVAPVVEQPELRYEYQPTDEHGRTLGGKQVIKYRTPDELAEKLRDQNIELVRKLRQVTREQRLGIAPKEELPNDLELMPKSVEYKELPLSIEERYALSQDLNDPEKFEAARDKLFESATGVAPKDFREQQNAQQFTVQQLLARTNAQQFFDAHPEFYVCEENLEVTTDWMIKNGLQPTVRNFELAQSKMQEAGLLVASPIVREEAPTPHAAPAQPAAAENTASNSQTPVEPATRISSDAQPQPKRQAQVPSGLNSRLASTTGPVSEPRTMSLADIDRMPSDEYKRRLTDPAFAKLVNELEMKRPPRPRRV
jgi:hypothetical protein